MIYAKLWKTSIEQLESFPVGNGEKVLIGRKGM